LGWRVIKNNRNPIIVINVNMASKGHQIGRLLATCNNVLWYDHEKNGIFPWLPCDGILNSELSKYHFDRRFDDESTIPPALDFARRSGFNERPEISYDRCKNGMNLLYVTHSGLDESHEYFNGKHLVVRHKDIDRFMETTWQFRVGKTKKLISDLYSEEEVKQMLDSTLINYEQNVNSGDFVIPNLDYLLDQDNFELLCDKFDLIFNNLDYDKVKQFLMEK